MWTFEVLFSSKICFSSIVLPIHCSLTVLGRKIGIRLEMHKDDYVLVLGMSPSRIGGERLSRTSLTKTRFVVTCRAHTH